MFQHRHMEKIAGVFRAMNPAAGMPTPAFVQHDEIVEKFADMLKESNPRFDRARFMTAARPV